MKQAKNRYSEINKNDIKYHIIAKQNKTKQNKSALKIKYLTAVF